MPEGLVDKVLFLLPYLVFLDLGEQRSVAVIQKLGGLLSVPVGLGQGVTDQVRVVQPF